MASKYCRPSDIITDSATISLTSGSADGSYPLSNLYDRYAHTVFKSVGTSCTIRAVFGAAKTLQAIALINHKLAGATVTVTNSAGFSRALTIPSNSEDGHCIDPWDTYVSLANTSATTWTITITGAATVVAIGELLLIQTLRTMNFQRGGTEAEQHGVISQQTDYGVRRKYELGVRQRVKAGELILTETLRDDLIALARDAKGPKKNFLLVPDDADNDALFVELATNPRELARQGPFASTVTLEFVEQQKGLAL